jgi:phage gpG-like protein
MITNTVDDSRAIRKLAAIPAAIRGRLVKTMTSIGYDLTGYIQQNKLQGQVLHHRTGNLSSHVHPEFTNTETQITTRVSIDANAVPYARIHEDGGYIKVPEVRGPLMVFESGGNTVFTRRHRAFTVNMPERSYMRSGLRERAPMYLAQIDAACREGARGATS